MRDAEQQGSTKHKATRYPELEEHGLPPAEGFTTAVEKSKSVPKVKQPATKQNTKRFMWQYNYLLNFKVS